MGPLGLYENMTSSTKLEIHNLSQRHQKRIKQQSQATCTKKFAEVRPRGFRVMRADRQTDKHTNITNLQYFAPIPGAK